VEAIARVTPKTGEKRNMKPNPLAEHCSQCGSSNVSLVERPMSPWDVLAMVPRALGFLSPAFFPLSMRANPRQRGASNLKLEKDLVIAPKPEQVIPHSNASLLFASKL
jgi:hypothetical protein